MAELDVESFSMEAPTFRANGWLTSKVLRKVEKFLAGFYGDDHANWHEMCLEAKKFIQNKQTTEQSNNLSENEISEWARLAIVHVMAQYEVY